MTNMTSGISLDSTAMGERIQRCRMAHSMSRDELAVQSNVTTAYIYDIEAGRRMPSASVLYRISKCLNKSLDYICSGNNTIQEENELTASLLTAIQENPDMERELLVRCLRFICEITVF